MSSTLIRPFTALKPSPGQAREVAAPPYDVVSVEEARARVRGRPWSFLHVSRPEIDLAAGTDPYEPEVYEKGAENLARMLDAGILRRDDRPCYYIYRLHLGNRVQTGIAVAASVDAYQEGRIRRHELTRPEKEDDRVRHIEALNAQTGPVFLVTRASSALSESVAEAVARSPDADFSADDGVWHTLWTVSDERMIETISQRLEDTATLYIADGHHRSAAAARVAASRRTSNAAHSGEESYNYFLAVIFPEDEVHILDYNRIVKDLNGLTRDTFLEKVGERFAVAQSDNPVRPAAPGEIGLYLPGAWYRLAPMWDRTADGGPVEKLDVSLLTDHLLTPVLGIADLRRDERIGFVGGSKGLGALERLVDSGEMAAAFSLYPTQISDLLSVADAGLLMPPKSTWFEPKLADGLLSHVLD